MNSLVFLPGPTASLRAPGLGLGAVQRRRPGSAACATGGTFPGKPWKNADFHG